MAYNPIPSPLNVVGNDVTAAISIAANATSSGACTSLGGAGTYTFQLTGTWVGTVQVQVTRDGSTWTNVTGVEIIWNLILGQPLNSPNVTTNGVWQINVTGLAGVRLITTAYTSGTITGTAAITPAAGMVALTGTNIIQTANGSVTGLIPRTSAGCLFYSGSIAATATAVKTTAGQVFGLQIYNSNSTPIYVQFFNTAVGGVTLGTTTPVLSVGVPATSSVAIEQSYGLAFGTAITVACTTTRTGLTAPTNTTDLNIFYA